MTFTLLWMLTFSSCVMDDPEDCCYNVRLEYRYQRYGMAGINELGYYVGSLREYVFDERDILVAINDYDVPHNGNDFFSEQNLSPGRYSVITLGNKHDYELINKEEIGSATKQKTLLTVNHPQIVPREVPSMMAAEAQDASDRLYYGYRSFEVGKFGVSRIAVDMTHSHCVLGLTVRWRDKSGLPEAGKNYVMILRQTPSLYNFMPEFVVSRGIEKSEFVPEEEFFSPKDRRRINYIPSVSRTDIVTHAIRNTAKGNALTGEFISFRYRNDSQVLLSIWSEAGQVMKEIDLNRFFRETGVNLDYSLCQEYNLSLEIDGDRVDVSMVEIDDWGDGGTF